MIYKKKVDTFMVRRRVHLSLILGIIALSLIGIVVSIYLTYNHVALTSPGSFCDITDVVSCSLVNTSAYSEFLNVPVALFGVLWFIILIALAWRVRSPNSLFVTALLGWNILGFLSVIYFITAEFLLQAICPLCTVVHVIITFTLLLSIILYRSEKHSPVFQALPRLKGWILAIVILNLLPILFFNLITFDQPNYDATAQCLTEKGVVMYGSFRCGVCAKTRVMFGESFQYIKEIECHPQGKDSQWQLCQQKEISGTPTWILEPQGKEIKRHTGFLSVKELQEFTGCK